MPVSSLRPYRWYDWGGVISKSVIKQKSVEKKEDIPINLKNDELFKQSNNQDYEIDPLILMMID